MRYLIALVLAAPAAGVGQIPQATPIATTMSPALAVLRDTPLADLARDLPAADSGYANTLLSSTDSMARAIAGNRIATDANALPFTIGVLLRERNAHVADYMLLNLYYFPAIYTDPRVPEMLRFLIATHSEPAVVAQALEQYRSITMRWLETTLTDRIAAAKRVGNDSLARALAPAQDRAVTLERGIVLPTFLRRAPPVFAKNVRSPAAIRVLAFGDFGTASAGQVKAAAAMRAYHAQHPFDFGITLGDNYYGTGLSRPEDPRWKTEFEDLYGPMGIEIFAAFGNHDQYDGDSPPAEIAYASRSRHWRFPAQFYTYTAGPAQFFVIDTNDPSEVQLQWLKDALEESHAAWKIVYGHFPPYVSAGTRGFTSDTLTASRIMPILKGRADVYLAGHHHSMQHLAPVDGVNLFISGAGGAGSYTVGEQPDPRVLFAKSDYGFAVMDITSTAFTMRFIDKDSKPLYQTTIKK